MRRYAAVLVLQHPRAIDCFIYESWPRVLTSFDRYLGSAPEQQQTANPSHA